MAKFTAPKGPKPASTEKTQAAPTVTTVPITKVEAENENKAELIAVITAAISAFEGQGGFKNNLIIRKISRVTGQTTAWANAGSVDAINSRRF